MKRRNGFTLVELLAVIAILAILVIIALPNVINMYNRARKSAFLTEAQNVLKTTTNKVIQEGVGGKKISVVSNNKNSLNLTGEKINYNVKLDNQGKITDYVISNDNFCISSKKAYDKLTIDDVSEDCSDIDLGDIAGTLMKNFFEKSGRTDRSLVYSIEFYNDGRMLGGEKHDVSEEQDGSITMYVKFSSENSAFLDLIIVADGKIALPEDSSKLFEFHSFTSNFSANLRSIEFNNSVDTSKVTNMSNMFYAVRGGSLDLSGFDTRNVVNMNSMFRMCNATDVNLNNFDTSKVTDMSYMFANSGMTMLNVSNFNTSNVTNMIGMFASNSSYEIKGLKNLNTSKVTDMSYMFVGTEATSLDVSNFDTRNVTNMNYMFCNSKATKLDLSSFSLVDGLLIKNMFQDSKASTVYVKDDAALTKLKGSSNVPSTLTFAVK